jgi:N-acetylmuramic acid 6-phosphate etherase
MISTTAMIRLGYVKGNRMTNVKAANEKLRDRSVRILMTETGLDEPAALKLLDAAGGDLRVALVMDKSSVDVDKALAVLSDNDYVVQKAIENIRPVPEGDNDKRPG